MAVQPMGVGNQRMGNERARALLLSQHRGLAYQSQPSLYFENKDIRLARGDAGHSRCWHLSAQQGFLPAARPQIVLDYLAP
jgi:hypothetical protein